MRTVYDPTELPPGRMYQVLTSSVVPRPIAWVSTVSEDGIANLAPYSFFSVSSANPPIVQFTSVTRKDTLRNIEATREFVINVATEPLMSVVNASSAGYEHSVDEFVELGVPTEPSARVRPPRVADSPVSIECALNQVIPVGNSFVVMGDVLAVTARHEVIDDDGLPNFSALAPLSRLGRNEWGLPPRVVALDRPTHP
ncbi:MAG: flavin reductase family protein [Rhodococcus sp.]|nr:flavin reductase family protein [Rhodococcus sp. (in: high G+C Gram-positive bacteria)]